MNRDVIKTTSVEARESALDLEGRAARMQDASAHERQKPRLVRVGPDHQLRKPDGQRSPLDLSGVEVLFVELTPPGRHADWLEPLRDSWMTHDRCEDESAPSGGTVFRDDIEMGGVA